MYTSVARTLTVLALSFAVAAGASGCTTPEPEPTEPPVATVDPTVQPTNTPEAPTAGLPVIRSCDELVSPQTVFDYNQNFAEEESFSPAAGTLAADAVAIDGIACAWVNQTSGETITVAVANPSSDELETRKAAAGRAASEFDGFYTEGADSGEAQAFTGPYWIIVNFGFFAEEGELAPFVESALESMKN